MIYETTFLMALCLTLIIEVPVLFLLTRFVFKNKKLSVRKIIISGLIASTLTLPYLWFVLPPYFPSNYYVFIGETLVVIFDTLIYMQVLEFKFRKAIIVSFVCNLASYLIGLYLLKYLIG